jgi:hypothetical protein
VNNPQKYGVTLPSVTNKPYFTQVTVKKPVSLAKVAKKSGVDVQTLHTLNPDYNHGIVPKKGSYTVLVPLTKAPVVTAQLVTPNSPAKTNTTTAPATMLSTAVPTTTKPSNAVPEIHKNVVKKALVLHHVKTTLIKAKKHTTVKHHIHSNSTIYHFDTVRAMEVKSKSV